VEQVVMKGILVYSNIVLIQLLQTQVQDILD
jgi:hypothetical protein